MSSSDEEGESDSSGEGVAFNPEVDGTKAREPIVHVTIVDEEPLKEEDSSTEEDTDNSEDDRRKEDRKRLQEERENRKQERVAARAAKKEEAAKKRREREEKLAKEEAALHQQAADEHRAEHADKHGNADDSDDDDLLSDRMKSPRSLAQMETGQLVIQFLRAEKLSKAGNFYAQAKLLAPKKEFLTATHLIKKNANPSWSLGTETPKIFNVKDVANSLLKVQVMSKVLGSAVSGEAIIDVRDLKPSVPYTKTLQLGVKMNRKAREERRVGKGAKAKELGTLTLNVMFFNVNSRYLGTEFSHPIHTMISKENEEAVLELLEMHDNTKDIQDPKGNTCLQLACKHDMPEITKALLEKKFDSKGAIHFAAGHSSRSLSQLLAAEVDINVADAEGLYPLHHAARHDNVEAVELLVAHGAQINQLSEDAAPCPPIVFAMSNNCDGAVEALAELKADIFLKGGPENKSAVDFFFSSKEKLGGGGDVLVADGADRGVHDVTKEALLDALGVNDPREFLMIQKGFTERFNMEGSRASHQFNLRAQQWTISVDEATTVQGIISMHGKVGLQNEAISFVVVVADEPTVYRLPSAATGAVAYADEAPVEIQLEAKKYYTIIPYTKSPDMKGSFSIVFNAPEGKDVDVVELKEWPYSDTVSGAWVTENAKGAMPNEDWEKNPHFALRVNRKRNKIHACVVLSQPRSANDVVPFAVTPYANFIGFYVYRDERHVHQMITPPDWKNSREVFQMLRVDGTKTPKLFIIPATYKPGQEKSFKVTVLCSNKLRLNALTEDFRDIIKEEKPVESPKGSTTKKKKKKKRVKKKKVKVSPAK